MNILHNKEKQAIFNRLIANSIIMNDLFMHCEAEDITLADYNQFIDNTIDIVAEIDGVSGLEKFRQVLFERIEEANK